MTPDTIRDRYVILNLWDSDLWRSVFIATFGMIAVLPQLGDIYLWMDEAETAVLGKSILTYGYPRMFDGRNLMSYYPPLHNSDYVEVVLPWLQYYLTAGSFWVFGVNTFAARLPFALCGIVALVIFPVLVRKLSADKWIQVVAPLMLIGFVPFLLYFRQCRYYGLVILCTMWLLWAYINLGEGRRWSAVHLTLAAVALFHSHYVVCAGTLIGLGIHWLLMYRDNIGIPEILKSSAVFLCLTVPWILYTQFWTHGYAWFSVHKVINYTGTLSARLVENFGAPLLICLIALILRHRLSPFWWITGVTTGIAMAGVGMNLTGFPYFAAACFACATVKGIQESITNKASGPVHLIWLVPVGVIVTLALLSPSNEIRYLVGLGPLAILAVVMGLNEARKRSPWLSTAIIVVFWTSNTFNALPASAIRLLPFTAWEAGTALSESEWVDRVGFGDQVSEEGLFYHRLSVMDAAIENRNVFRSLPVSYFLQIVRGFDGPFERLVLYMNNEGTPADVVKIDYGVVPLIFYTDMRILPEHLLSDPSYEADWVVLHGGDFVTPSPEFMKVLEKQYERIILPLPDLLWDNRPELDFHLFAPPVKSASIQVYRKL